MKCPFYGSELKEGFIYSPRTLNWTDQPLRTFLEARLSRDGNVILAETGLLTPAKAVAHNCSCCKKILISY